MGNRTLRRGDSGEDVRDLQTQVCAALQIAGQFDGEFGPTTEANVRRYQVQAGLVPDGVVGAATWAALDRDSRPPAAEPGGITAGGWYPGAKRVDAHASRIGGTIVPTGFVIHATDMLENTFSGLIHRWSTEPGERCAAHWLIGRSPAQGVVQMISALRNGNHAGGSRIVGGSWQPFHGSYKTPTGKLVHPNTWTLGVEVHAGGYLGRRTPRGFVHKDSGQVIPDADVYVDKRGIGWHVVTQYQLDELAKLTKAVRAFLSPMPAGTTIVPNGTYADNGASWAVTKTTQIVGHVTLDPANKTDPGPQLIDWINAL